MQSSSEYPLRPLTIGEIFDRAVTIYVRNFVPFTLIVLTLLAPLAILQYFALPSSASSLAQIAKQASDPKATVSPFTNEQLALLFGVVFLAAIFAPFINNAVAVGVARLYSGDRPNYGQSFAKVFQRWLPLIGTAFVNLLILGGLYGFTVFVLMIVVIIGVTLVQPALPLAIAFFVLAGIGLLAVIPLFLMLLIVYAFSTYATSIEDANVSRAIASGFSRVFGRKELKKSILMALAYIALEIGVLTIGLTVAVVLQMVLKLDAVQLVITTVMNAVLTAFLAILLAVYYYDVRTRTEGLDLETDLQRLSVTG